MSFNFSGSYLEKTTNLPTSTNSMTHVMWLKRTADFTTRRYLGTIRSSGESTGHQLFVNDSGNSGTHMLQVQSNYGAGTGWLNEALELNVWEYLAIVGSGANLSLKFWDGDSFVTVTVGQTAFTPAVFRWGQDGYATSLFTGLAAHLRTWSGVLSDSELQAEMNSDVVVKSSGLLLAHSGGGGSIATALTGQTGGAYTNGGGVTYSADMPSLSSFSGTVISGTAAMPGTTSVTPTTGSRVNRVLWSNDLSNSVWTKGVHNVTAVGAVAAPSGYGLSHRIIMQSNTGGVYQTINNVPAGKGLMSMIARRVNTDYVRLNNYSADANNGAHLAFNMVTKTFLFSNTVGTATDGSYGWRELIGGWFFLWVAVTVAPASGSRNFGFIPVTNFGSTATGLSVDVAAFQYEDTNGGTLATLYKPTTSAPVFRNLSAINVSLAIDTIGVTQTIDVTAQLLDTAGSPWDQDGPVEFASSDSTKASVDTGVTPIADFSGHVVTQALGVASGTTNITATLGDVVSAPKQLTVSGTAVARFVDIRVEFGWGETTNWWVGVYQKHVSARFPTTKLFEASGQRFVTLGDQSQMLVPVPAGISVTAGQTVEVVVENDNVNGTPVDGPGSFTATIV